MSAGDVLTAEPQTLEQIASAVDRHRPPWLPLTPLMLIRGEIAALVNYGVAVRVSLPVGDGWRLAGAT